MRQLKKKPAAAKARIKLAADIKKCRAIVRELRAMPEPRVKSAVLERLARIARFMEQSGITEREIGTPAAEIDRLCAERPDVKPQWIDVDLADEDEEEIPIVVGEACDREPARAASSS